MNTPLEIYYSEFGCSCASSRAFFHNALGYGSFIYDFDEKEKYLLTKDPKASEIVSLSADGKLALAIDTTFDTLKRFIRMIEVETQIELMATKVAFGYEALFSPIADWIVIRGDIKKREKVFVYNWKTDEIVYTFPGANPLSYGCLNQELHAFVLPNPRKKAEVFYFDFQTEEGQTVALPSKRLIHRASLISDQTYFYIDGDYNATLIRHGEITWQVKLDFDSDLYYAPAYFIANNKVYFSYLYGVTVEGKTEEQPCFYTLDLDNGQLNPIVIPKGELAGSFLPFLNNKVINNFGTSIDLNTLESGELSTAIFSM